MNEEDLSDECGRLPHYVDRALLERIIQRIPPDARVPFVRALAASIPQNADELFGMKIVGLDPETAQLVVELVDARRTR